MSYPILFQPRWFSPLLKESPMWRLNPSCTTKGQACVSGPKPFVVLTGQSTQLITPEAWMMWKNRIETNFPVKKNEFPFDLSGQLSADEIAVLQTELTGIQEVNEPLADTKKTHQTTAVKTDSTHLKDIDATQLDGTIESTPITHKALEVASAESSETSRRAHEETFWEHFARKIIDPPFNHHHGVLGFSTSENDTLHDAARRFLAFLDAGLIEWTHVISFGRESLLAAFLALHYPHRIGSLIIIDTPILPDCIPGTAKDLARTERSPGDTQGESHVVSSSAFDSVESFLRHYPSSEQLKFMLHPILYITTEQSAKTNGSTIDHHKQAVNIKKVIKLKDIDGDALRHLVLGKQTIPMAEKSPSHIDTFCDALGKWHDRFDLMSYVNRRWASARSEYFRDLEKQEVK